MEGSNPSGHRLSGRQPDIGTGMDIKVMRDIGYYLNAEALWCGRPRSYVASTYRPGPLDG
jgi:hypothetical protein